MRAPYSKEQEAREGGISHHCKSICSPIPVSNYIYYIFSQERIRTATRVRACNYVKIETRWNFPPVLKIVTRTAQAA